MMFGYGLLVCLLVGWAAAQYMEDTTAQKSKYPSECQTLVQKFKLCGELKNWTNAIQEYFAKMLGKEEFANRTRDCLYTAYAPGEGVVACTQEKPMEVMLHCTRMALFKMVAVEKKVAAIRFHIGFQHCVLRSMGFRPENDRAIEEMSLNAEDDVNANPINSQAEEDEWNRRGINPTDAPEYAASEEDATFYKIVTRRDDEGIKDAFDDELEEGNGATYHGYDSNEKEESPSQ